MKQDDRNLCIDFLRCVGIFLVILAHVSAPKVIYLFRSFDVVLLVMISGYCAHYTHGNYLSYIKKRINRLCIPAWIAATIIFLLCIIICAFSRIDFIFSFRQIIETYLFIGGIEGGIGLFWIVRIFLLMACVVPISIDLSEKIKNDYLFLIICVLVLIVNDIIYFFFWGKSKTVNILLENIIISTIAYFVPLSIGYRLKSKPSSLKEFLCASIVGFLSCIIYLKLTSGKYIVSDFKYPPRMMYIIFGLFGSCLLWYVTHLSFAKFRIRSSVIQWVSRNSYNIYFTHAIIMNLRSWSHKYWENIGILNKWYVTYILVLMCSIALVYLYQIFIEYVTSIHNNRSGI